MKKIIYGAILAITTLAYIGCNSDNDPNDGRFGSEPSSGWITIDSDTKEFSAPSNCGDSLTELRIPIKLIAATDTLVAEGPTNKNGIDIQYTINQISGSMDNIVIQSVNIPAGQREGNIIINYPSNLTASSVFTITLNSTSVNEVAVSAPDDVEPTVVTVNINVGRDILKGNYVVTRQGVADYESVITAGVAPNELIISNLFGNEPLQLTSTRVFLNDDGTISYPPFIDNFLRVGTGTQGNIYVDGNVPNAGGEYNLCEGTLTLRYRLRFGPTQNQTSALTTSTFVRGSLTE